jgi:hypothetical protein
MESKIMESNNLTCLSQLQTQTLAISPRYAAPVLRGAGKAGLVPQPWNCCRCRTNLAPAASRRRSQSLVLPSGVWAARSPPMANPPESESTGAMPAGGPAARADEWHKAKKQPVRRGILSSRATGPGCVDRSLLPYSRLPTFGECPKSELRRTTVRRVGELRGFWKRQLPRSILFDNGSAMIAAEIQQRYLNNKDVGHARRAESRRRQERTRVAEPAPSSVRWPSVRSTAVLQEPDVIAEIERRS